MITFNESKNQLVNVQSTWDQSLQKKVGKLATNEN
jgi:hypothetical protein